MAVTKLGFQIESGLTTEYLTDSKFIRDTYYVVADRAALNGLKIVSQSNVSGSLCFVEDARTTEEIANDTPAYGRYFKYDAVNQIWILLDASDVQLNTTQDLSQILPKVFRQADYTPILLVTQEEYDAMLHAVPTLIDDNILYLIYESSFENIDSQSSGSVVFNP